MYKSYHMKMRQSLHLFYPTKGVVDLHNMAFFTFRIVKLIQTGNLLVH